MKHFLSIGYKRDNHFTNHDLKSSVSTVWDNDMIKTDILRLSKFIKITAIQRKKQ